MPRAEYLALLALSVCKVLGPCPLLLCFVKLDSRIDQVYDYLVVNVCMSSSATRLTANVLVILISSIARSA